ncbi:MAG: hypothetical protein H0V53_10410 [Rubrobacter sp.]|nr:hypothetical protein [Rubrobacter sp.]
MSEPNWWLNSPVCLKWNDDERSETLNAVRWIVDLVREIDRGLAVMRFEDGGSERSRAAYPATGAADTVRIPIRVPEG